MTVMLFHSKLVCLCTIRDPKSSLRAQMSLFLYEVIDFQNGAICPEHISRACALVKTGEKLATDILDS